MTRRAPIDEARLLAALRGSIPLPAPDALHRSLVDLPRRDQARALRFPVRGGWIAVAAALLLVATGVFVAEPWNADEPTEAEVAAAAAQLRLVLASASRAVRDAPAAALEHTLAESVAPALRRTPLARPGS